MQRLTGTQVPLAVSLEGGRPGDLLVVDRAGQTGGCLLADAKIVLDTRSVVGCDGQSVPAAWEREAYLHCGTAQCLSLTVYRTRPGRQPHRVGWRLLPVDDARGSLSLLVDGPVMQSSGGGWLTVAAPTGQGRGTVRGR